MGDKAGPDTADLTRDAFLGGRVMAWQPARGFRAGVDSVMLAAGVPARAGQSVLELGCGAGVAALCLAARVPGLRLTGVELQADCAALAARNGTEAGIDLDVLTADLRALPASVRGRSFDHVMANPPFFDRTRSPKADDPGREVAHGGPTPLADWVDVAARRLTPAGWLTLIQRIDRLPEVLAALDTRLGSITVLPLAGRTGRQADRFVLRARKGGRAPFRLAAPLILHDGPRHLTDGEDYSATARAVLRDAAALPFPD